MLYKIEVSDGLFPQKFKGEFFANTEQEAINEAKSFYACELGTSEDFIKIVSTSVVN